LFSGKLENLRVAVQDKIHQPYRASLIENLDNVFRISYELGSLGTYVSGAGPTIISMIDAEDTENFAKYAAHHLDEKEIVGWQIKVLNTDSQGAQISIE